MLNQKEQQAIEEMIAFAEGRIPFLEFENNYKTNKIYRKLLNTPVMRPEDINWRKEDTFNRRLLAQKWNTAHGRMAIHHMVEVYLLHHANCNFNSTEKYVKEWSFYFDITPRYVGIDNEEFLDSVIRTAPQDLTIGKKKKWLKEKIKSIFRFDTTPPRWIQDPEWPIVGGRPLVFRKQSRQKFDDERVFYTFYDPATGEETVITQFY